MSTRRGSQDDGRENDFSVIVRSLTAHLVNKLVQGSMPLPISHEKSEIELHLEIVAPTELAATQAVRINDSRKEGQCHAH
jgi:hypothetical protein